MDPKRQTPAPLEKDRYTYDEMMDRLRGQRSGGDGSGRVKVESADGSVEVRKRKRRSHQPKKIRQARLAKFRKLAIIALIALVVILIGLSLLLKVRYQSDGFRNDLSQRTSEIVGAPVTLDPLSVKGFTVRSRRLLIDPLPTSILRDVEFTSLSGKLSAGSLASPNWRLTTLESTYATLRFQSPQPSFGANTLQSSDIPILGAGFGFTSKPDEILIDKARISSADFVWSGGRREPAFVTETTISSSSVGSRTSMKLSGGDLKIPGWPEFGITSASIDFNDREIQIDEAALAHQLLGRAGGEASVRGTISLDGGSANANIVCQLDDLPAISIIDEAWQTKLTGQIESTLNFRADLAQPGSLEVSGPFWIRNGTLGDIAPTKRLSAFLAEPRLDRVGFHSIRGKIKISNGTRTVTELDALAPDFIHVTGTYSISSENFLSGTLEVAINDKTLNKMPGGKPAFFGASDPVTAMSKASVTLGGTCSAPQEDLTPRLEAAIEKFRKDSAAPPASAYPTIPVDPNKAKRNEAQKKAEAAFEKLIEP